MFETLILEHPNEHTIKKLTKRATLYAYTRGDLQIFDITAFLTFILQFRFIFLLDSNLRRHDYIIIINFT